MKGAIHNVYVTPDGKHVVSGSIPGRMITVIDQATETIAWELPMSAGIRPMAFERAADGSTSRIFVQLSDYHGIAVVDFKRAKEVARFEMPAIPGRDEAHRRAPGAPMHGFAVTPDGKLLLATSKVYSTMYAYSLPDLEAGRARPCRAASRSGSTLTPDGKRAYVAAAGRQRRNVSWTLQL